MLCFYVSPIIFPSDSHGLFFCVYFQPGENGYDREPILKRQISELNIQIKRLEEQCSSYKQDKADLVRKTL